MKAKLTIDGKEFEVDISEEQVQTLTETKKKTGYERVKKDEYFYIVDIDGEDLQAVELNSDHCNDIYKNGNYYSDETIAKNNARAGTLYRQLRRFAAEHRKEKLDWNNKEIGKWFIYYDHYDNVLNINFRNIYQFFGCIAFDTRENAKLAIDTFKDELLWYFTEYKDSL